MTASVTITITGAWELVKFLAAQLWSRNKIERVKISTPRQPASYAVTIQLPAPDWKIEVEK